MSARANLNIVLHAHLPYVLGHGRWPHGTDWLCEAVVETYLPLWRLLTRLVESGRRPRLTLGLTPVLCEQLASPVFREEIQSYLDLKTEAARRDGAEFHEGRRTRLEGHAARWRAYYDRARRDLDSLGWDLIGSFRDLAACGAVEILTSAATHGYLPLLGRQSAVRAQLRAAVLAHRRHFGRDPRGIWLPECGYRPAGAWQPAVGDSAPSWRPGLEDFLAPLGLRYFVVDTHLVDGARTSASFELAASPLRERVAVPDEDGLLTAEPRPPAIQPPSAGLAPYRPYRVGHVVAFARDPHTSKVVWSSREGYPGDPRYLEFHKRHHPGGLRYWRITDAGSGLGEKLEYDEREAREAAVGHAAHFAQVASEIAGRLQAEIDRPVIVAPYDAELFGHWWFEGPVFLERALERLGRAPELALGTLGDAIEAGPAADATNLPEGSWGEGGDHRVWLNADTRFVWRLVYDAERKFESLAQARADRAGRLEGRVLRQLARTLLLLEASDWPFLITSRTAHDYAERRVLEHHEDFKRLHAIAVHLGRGGAPTPRDLDVLETLERRDAVFPDVDPAWWR
jgi:1,4-alpha-glucan branching enzyme